jgi:uncharacterized protein
MSFWIGLASGAFGGLVGLGGGVIAVPLMHFFLGFTQLQATAASLLMVVGIGLAGALTYAWQGSVYWLGAGLIFPTGMLAARLGANLASQLPERNLKKVFGAYLAAVALLLLLKPYIPHVETPLQGWNQVLPLVLAGGAAGFASGLMGIGGGTITVPILVLLAGLEQHTAQGTSLLAMVPAALVGSYTHFKHGSFAPRLPKLLPGLLLGLSLGVITGGWVAHYLSELWLRLAFALVLLWTASSYRHNPKGMK